MNFIEKLGLMLIHETIVEKLIKCNIAKYNISQERLVNKFVVSIALYGENNFIWEAIKLYSWP